MLTGPLPQDPSAYESLERRRLKFTELGNTLELYAPRVQPDSRSAVLAQAAEAYRDAGDETDELRVTRPLVLAQDAGLRDRFLDLLLRHDRAALIALAGTPDQSLADAAANYAVAHGTEAQALGAVAARSRNLQPVWRPAMASLVETNFASATIAANTSNFTQSLASDAIIANRLAARADPAKQLTGELWFYYASRFGIFLATVPKAAPLPDAEDFLPAESRTRALRAGGVSASGAQLRGRREPRGFDHRVSPRA